MKQNNNFIKVTLVLLLYSKAKVKFIRPITEKK